MAILYGVVGVLLFFMIDDSKHGRKERSWNQVKHLARIVVEQVRTRKVFILIFLGFFVERTGLILSSGYYFSWVSSFYKNDEDALTDANLILLISNLVSIPLNLIFGRIFDILHFKFLWFGILFGCSTGCFMIYFSE